MATIYCKHLKKNHVRQVDTEVCRKCRKLKKCPDFWGWKQMKLFKDFK
ncbi:MAG: hypothetical protein KKA41_07575 [Proteobacteria bacterium]|nr:hypothetical protein [Pseudomonadota bacterium]